MCLCGFNLKQLKQNYEKDKKLYQLCCNYNIIHVCFQPCTGIILFTANGLFSFVALAMLLFNRNNFPSFIIAQGIVLSGWLLVQMLIIQTVYFLHYVLGAVGILLIVSGAMLRQIKINKTDSNG